MVKTLKLTDKIERETFKYNDVILKVSFVILFPDGFCISVAFNSLSAHCENRVETEEIDRDLKSTLPQVRLQINRTTREQLHDF